MLDLRRPFLIPITPSSGIRASTSSSSFAAPFVSKRDVAGALRSARETAVLGIAAAGPVASAEAVSRAALVDKDARRVIDTGLVAGITGP
jgi:hypothetical protein